MDERERNQWREADRLFQRLIELDADARQRFLQSDGIGAEVRAKLDQMLESSQRSHRLLDSDAPGLPWNLAGDMQIRDQHDTLPGRRLGDWKLIELIGRGGMAAVYRAERVGQDYQQRAAVKLLGIALHGEAERNRFRRERQILAQLQHPHIASLIDAGVADDGTPFLAMSLVDGERIDHYCDKRDLRIAARVELLLQVCAAASYAHRQLVIHRDIKPGNILVDASGHATLLDFGIARLLETDDTGEQTFTRAFTPDYAAPEQRSGQFVPGTGIDVYGLGAVLHRLLAGAPPRQDGHGDPLPASRIASERGDVQTARALRGDLDAVLAQALASDPQQRYGSVDALAGDLRAWLRHRPLLARRASMATRLGKFVRRNRTACALALLAVLAAAIGLVSFVLSNRALQRRAAELQAVTQFQIDMLQRIVPRDVAIHLHKALTDAIQQTAPDSADKLDPAIAKIDYTGLVIDMLDEAVLRRSLTAVRKRFTDQPRVEGKLLEQVAIDYLDLGRFEQAKPILAEATAVFRKALGEGDPLTLMSLREQLKLVRKMNPPDGEALHRKVLQLHLRYLGADSVDTNRAREALGQWLMQHGKAKAAEPLIREALSAEERIEGTQDANTVATRANLAMDISEQGRDAEAVPLLRQTVVDATRVFGTNGSFTLDIKGNLAHSLNQIGKTREAELLYREVYQARRRMLGAQHPSTLAGLNNLAVQMRRDGSVAEAEPLQRQAYQGLRKLWGAHDARTLHVGLNLARDQVALGKFDAAISLLNELLPDWQERNDRLAISRAQRLLGRSLQGEGKRPEAEHAYEQSWQAAAAIHRADEQHETAQAAVTLDDESSGSAAQRSVWQQRLRDFSASAGSPKKQNKRGS